MTAIRLPDLLARFSSTNAPVHTAFAKTKASALYATAFYSDDDVLPRYFAIGIADQDDFPIYLTMFNGALEAWPSIPDIDAFPVGKPTPFIAPLWLTMLHHLCTSAVKPNIDGFNCIPFLEDPDPTKPNFTQVACRQIVDDQLEKFRFNRRAFFPSHTEWFEWECWSRAKSWLRGKITAQQACTALEVDVATHEAAMREVLKKCRSSSRSLAAKNSDEWIDANSPLTPPAIQSDAVVGSVMKLFVNPPQLGGDPDLVFPRDAGCIHTLSFPDPDTTRMEPPKNMWWWRSLNSPDDWSDDLHELFVQNWARSAFFYEYRCRRNRMNEAPWFGVPWPTLNHVQRAILRSLWPPLVGGSQTIVRPVTPALSDFGNLSQITLQISVDLSTMSDGVIIEHVERMLKAERKKRNLSSFSKGEGRAQQTFRWKVLEAMDEAFYSDYTLSGSDRTGKTAVEKSYLEACKVAQIEP